MDSKDDQISGAAVNTPVPQVNPNATIADLITVLLVENKKTMEAILEGNKQTREAIIEESKQTREAIVELGKNLGLKTGSNVGTTIQQVSNATPDPKDTSQEEINIGNEGEMSTLGNTQKQDNTNIADDPNNYELTSEVEEEVHQGSNQQRNTSSKSIYWGNSSQKPVNKDRRYGLIHNNYSSNSNSNSQVPTGTLNSYSSSNINSRLPIYDVNANNNDNNQSNNNLVLKSARAIGIIENMKKRYTYSTGSKAGGILDFNSTYREDYRVIQVCTPDIKKNLRGQYPDNNSNTDSDDVVLDHLLHMAKPNGIENVKEQIDTVEFPSLLGIHDWTNFPKYCDASNIFGNNFSEIMRVICKYCSDEDIPPLLKEKNAESEKFGTLKTGSLITMFLNKFPSPLALDLHDKCFKKESYKWVNEPREFIITYIEKFLAKLAERRKMFNEDSSSWGSIIKNMPTTNPFRGNGKTDRTKAKESNAVVNYVGNQVERRDFMWIPNNNDKVRKKKFSKKQLSNIEQQAVKERDGEDIYSTEVNNIEDRGKNEKTGRNQEQSGSAICFNQYNKKECNKANCKYNHDEAAIKQYHQQLTKLHGFNCYAIAQSPLKKEKFNYQSRVNQGQNGKKPYTPHKTFHKKEESKVAVNHIENRNNEDNEGSVYSQIDIVSNTDDESKRIVYHIGPPDEDETEYYSMSEKSSDDGSEAEYQDGFYMISMAQTLAENITADNETMESATPQLSNLHVMRSEPHYIQYRLTVGEGYVRGQALIDTGSTDFNYLSLRLYNKLEKDLVHLTEIVNHDVVVADGKTKLHIDKKVRIPIMLKVENTQYKYTMDFMVLPMSQDIIIGSPALGNELLTFFLHHWKVRCESNKLNVVQQQPMNEPKKIATHLGAKPTYYLPFGDVPRTLTPEEKKMGLPTFNEAYLYLMENDYADRMVTYKSLLNDHVDPKMREVTQIMKLLNTKWVMDVFVPPEWTGIRGKPIDIEFTPDLPSSLKPEARPVNPKLLETANNEFLRLCQYMLVRSNSNHASPIVIASKDQPPYIRIVGDYRVINQYMINGHVPIPNVRYQVERIAGFRYFTEFDLTNAFHQFLLSLATSLKLSIQTSWGEFRPLYMPEGIGPATGILQQRMTEMFGCFKEWCIVLFDNVLILANTHEDLYQKVEMFLKKCAEFNVTLKMAKSNIGFDKAEFFGYIVQHKSYTISPERIQGLANVKLPGDMVALRRLMGAAIFLHPFVANYAKAAGPLYDMLKKSYDWNQLDTDATLKANYERNFKTFIQSLSTSMSLFYPDYSLDWILRTDASEYGYGAVLLQVNKEGQNEPIALISEKFSVQAVKWATIEQEGFAIQDSVRKLQYYLRCKRFVLQTDHRNLIWMAKSEVPKIIRWRIFLQSFNFVIQHIPGKVNILADLMSRSALNTIVQGRISNEGDENTLNYLTPILNEKVQWLEKAHNGKNLHPGVKKTYENLMKANPKHDITVDEVRKYVAECPICQKMMYGKHPTIQPRIKTLKADNARSVIAMDGLQLQLDSNGYLYMIVIINLFTKHVHLTPTKDKSAITAAKAIFTYFACYGLCDIVRSDPGSDYTSTVVQQLLNWLGPAQSLTLVDRPQADGVERLNREILKRITILCMEDIEIRNNWSDISVYMLVQYVINNSKHSETGFTPFQLQFASIYTKYFDLPQLAHANNQQSNESIIIKLQKNLEKLRDISYKYQSDLKDKRRGKDISYAVYQPGTYVLIMSEKTDRKDKLYAVNLGPYKVVTHLENNVTLESLIDKKQQVVHVGKLRIFFGTDEDALKCAKTDNDQVSIIRIISYIGNYLKRTTCQFMVLFDDNSQVLLPYSEVYNTVQFELFCTYPIYLKNLLIPAAVVDAQLIKLNKERITGVDTNTEVYVNVRTFGNAWYEKLKLPNLLTTNYVLRAVYGKYKNPKEIYIAFPGTKAKTLLVNQWYIQHIGSERELDQRNTLLTAELIQTYEVTFPK